MRCLPGSVTPFPPAASPTRGSCAVEVREIAHSPSLDFPDSLRARISAVAQHLGLSWREIYSAAGHDARQMHYHCESGMIFIPVQGRSQPQRERMDGGASGGGRRSRSCEWSSGSSRMPP